MTNDETQYLISALPESPPPEMISWAEEYLAEELGGEWLIFHNARMEQLPTMAQLMDNETRGKSRWKTVCCCSACGSEFVTERAGSRSFFLADDECGGSYPLDDLGNPDESLFDPLLSNWNAVEYTSGDGATCPFCDSVVRIVHASEVRGGRTKRIQIAQLTNVGQYTAVILWLISREISERGHLTYGEPRYAYVLGWNGALAAFSHRSAGYLGFDNPALHWRRLTACRDRWETRYSDWGSINNTKVGTAIWGHRPNATEMAGTTGEKTAVAEYWGAIRPVEYLKLWKKANNVEQLVLAGFRRIVADAIEEGLRYGSDSLTELRKAVRLEERKPHRMLGVSRQGMAQLKCCQDPYGALKLWARYEAAGGRESIEYFLTVREQWGSAGMDDAIRIMDEYGGDLGKLQRYFEKQGMSGRQMGLLRDSRNMARKLSDGQALTEEELWPRHLHQTHDRLAELLAERREDMRKNAWQQGFDAVRREYGALQWNDGRLAVMLPVCAEDLIREGKTLRHCVGGYAETHAEGKSIILFVRHYRRPERSYYTLNMSFGGDHPNRIQLHGYGNEHHGDRKQYTHTIPGEVLRFVDRWEKEVVAPWWRQKQSEQKGRKPA